VFRQGTIEAIINPQNLNQGVLERADILTLSMIRDNWGKRPIYFSRTSGMYPSQLGLGEYMLTQGLARKLLPTPAVISRDTVPVQGEGAIDVNRSMELWNKVFMGQKSIIARGDWVDKPSAGIPALYVSVGIFLSDALRASGRMAEATQVAETAKKIAVASRTLNWFGGEAGILGTPAGAGLPALLDTSGRTAVPLGAPADSGAGGVAPAAEAVKKK
jgi:hypothetical protein